MRGRLFFLFFFISASLFAQAAVVNVSGGENGERQQTSEEEYITADDVLVLDMLWNARTNPELIESADFRFMPEENDDTPEKLYTDYLKALAEQGVPFEKTAAELLYAECAWYMCFARPIYGIGGPAADEAALSFMLTAGENTSSDRGKNAYRLIRFLLDAEPSVSGTNDFQAEIRTAMEKNSYASYQPVPLLAKYVQAAARAAALFGEGGGFEHILQEGPGEDQDMSAALMPEGLAVQLLSDPELLYVVQTAAPYAGFSTILENTIQYYGIEIPPAVIDYTACEDLVLDAEALCAEYGIPLEHLLSQDSYGIYMQIRQNDFALAALGGDLIRGLSEELQFITAALPLFCSRTAALLFRESAGE